MNEKTAVESVIGKMRSWLREADAMAAEDARNGGHTRILAFPKEDIRAMLEHIDGESTRSVSTGYPRLGAKLTGGDLKKGGGT